MTATPSPGGTTSPTSVDSTSSVDSPGRAASAFALPTPSSSLRSSTSATASAPSPASSAESSLVAHLEMSRCLLAFRARLISDTSGGAPKVSRDLREHELPVAALPDKPPLTPLLTVTREAVPEPLRRAFAVLRSRESACVLAAITALGESLRVHVSQRPDHTRLETEVTFEPDVLDDEVEMAHPPFLDDDGMPVCDPHTGVLKRDTAKRKTTQPVVIVVRTERQRPRPVLCDPPEEIPAEDIADTLPIRDAPLLRRRLLERVEAPLDALERATAAGTRLSAARRTRLRAQVSAVEAVVSDGFELSTTPTQHAYVCRLHVAAVEATSRRLALVREALDMADRDGGGGGADESDGGVAGADVDFVVTHRPELASELAAFLPGFGAARHAIVADPHKGPVFYGNMLFSLAMAAKTLACDANYHGALDHWAQMDTVAMTVADLITDAMAPQEESQSVAGEGGTIMCVFRFFHHAVIAVSSRFDAATAQWERWVHLNTAACAHADFEDLQRRHSPEMAEARRLVNLGDGIRVVRYLTTPLDLAYVLAFPPAAIDKIRQTAHEGVRGLSASDYTDEVGIGRRTTAGTVNWASRYSSQRRLLNHLCMEAAMLNADPQLCVRESDGSVLSPADSLDDLVALAEHTAAASRR